jgi:hypothetical protein
MKNLIKFIIVITMGLFLFTSCEEEESTPLIEHVSFWHDSTQTSIELLKQPEENQTAYVVLEWTGKELTSDKQVTLNVVESQTTAKEGAHYQWINKTVTLKAGQRFTKVDIFEVIHARFMLEEEVKLTLRLDSESDVQVYGSDRITYNMKLRNVCPVEITDLEGTYSVTDYSDGVPYESYEVTVSQKNEDTLTVSNFAAYAAIFASLPDIEIVADVTPGDETVSIPYQHYATHSSVGPMYISSPHPSGAEGRIETCGTIKIITSYNICDEAGACYSNWWVTESVWTKTSSKKAKNLKRPETTQQTLTPVSK